MKYKTFALILLALLFFFPACDINSAKIEQDEEEIPPVTVPDDDTDQDNTGNPPSGNPGGGGGGGSTPSLTQEEADNLFYTLLSSFNGEMFISDVIQTHREIGDYEETVRTEAWADTTEAQKEVLIEEFKRENVGNTGIADYLNAFDIANSAGSIYSVAASGYGAASVPFKNEEGSEYPQGIRFGNISIKADDETVEERKGLVTLDLVFMDDYNNAFSEESGLSVKSGSEIFISFDCDYAFSGEGHSGDNARLSINSYSISTLDPNADNEELAVQHEPNGLCIIVGDKEYDMEIEELSGIADGYFGLDYQVQLLLAIKATVTLDSIGMPMHDSERILIDGVSANAAVILDEINQQPALDE